MKICYAASSGGHYAQILQLRPIMEKCDGFIVTEKTETYQDNGERTYFLKQTNRKEWKCLFYLLYNSFYSLCILCRERPDYIITTGVLAIIPLCLLGKLFGIKLIYIESFAKVHSPTMTGKFLYKFADYFFVQWESMKEFYPNAICLGGIY